MYIFWNVVNPPTAFVSVSLCVSPLSLTRCFCLSTLTQIYIERNKEKEIKCFPRVITPNISHCISCFTSDTYICISNNITVSLIFYPCCPSALNSETELLTNAPLLAIFIPQTDSSIFLLCHITNTTCYPFYRTIADKSNFTSSTPD